MKKIITIMFILIIGYITYIFQSNIFRNFTIAGVKPNLFIILMLFLGLNTRKSIVTIIAIILGLMVDLFIGRGIGNNAIMFTIIGFLGVELDKKFSKNSRLTMIIMISIITIIYELGINLLNILLLNINFDINVFIRILVIEIIYTIMITIILYPILQKTGETLETIFKDKKTIFKYY